MALSLRRFRKMLLASGLIEAGELRAFERSLPASQRPATTDDLSRRLIEVGRLTDFQATEIRAGRGSALVLGNYVVIDRIGAGGMGQVFKALHRRMQRLVALKTLPDQRAAGEDSIARFRREILSAAQLLHPNIVAAYDADVAQHIHFLVMEYVDGPNLADLVRKQGPLPVGLAVRYVLDAARGLAYAHERGIVHRDVKPSNLIVSPSGSVKVLDMGLARAATPIVGAELTMPGDVVGTLEYMAPEQAAGASDIDHRADIYGLGCTLFRLTTGEFPYRGATPSALIAAHRDDNIPSLKASREEVPKSLDNVFKRMVAKQPSDRFQTMDDVLRALEKLRLAERRPPREEAGRPSPALDLGERSPAALQTDNAESSSPQRQSVPGGGQHRGEDDDSGDDLVLVPPAGEVIFEPVDPLGDDAQGLSPAKSRIEPVRDKTAPSVSPSIALAAILVAMIGITGLSWLDSKHELDGSHAQPREAPLNATPRESVWQWSNSLKVPASMTNSLGMSFVLIPPAGEPDNRPSDSVSTPFYYGTCEVTVAQFRHFVKATGYRGGDATRSFGGSTPPGGMVQGDRHPVIGITPADAEAFCHWLNQLEAASYRLPTQAEWSHACGVGLGRKAWFEDEEVNLHRYAWCQSNSGGRTHQVGLLEASPFGLHDLIGNAAEWCVAGNRADRPLPSPSRYVLCGGCWSTPIAAFEPGAASRVTTSTGGLRLALDLPLEAHWPHRSAASSRRPTR